MVEELGGKADVKSSILMGMVIGNLLFSVNE